MAFVATNAHFVPFRADGDRNVAAPWDGSNAGCTLCARAYGSTMINVEEIRSMPLRDKLQLIETLWDDIARSESALEMPQWHKDLLDERERLVEAGEAKFLDWDEAKRQIAKATR